MLLAPGVNRRRRRRAARRGAGQRPPGVRQLDVGVLHEQAGHQPAARTGARLLEDRLEVVLHRVRGHAEAGRDGVRGMASRHELGDRALPLGESERGDDEGRQLGRARRFEADGHRGVGPVAEQRGPHGQPVSGRGAHPCERRAAVAPVHAPDGRPRAPPAAAPRRGRARAGPASGRLPDRPAPASRRGRGSPRPTRRGPDRRCRRRRAPVGHPRPEPRPRWRRTGPRRR